LTRGLAALLALLLAAAGCGRHGPPPGPPSPDRPQAAVPDLAGRAVMVLPAQLRNGAGELAGLDAEIAFWLGERGGRVSWTFPPAIDRMLQRNAMLGIDPRALAVDAFARAEVRNIGDPLFGDLRRLGALADTRYALIPTSAVYRRLGEGEGERVEIAAALIDTVGGRVIWFGVVAGAAGARGSGAAASAAEALARAVVR
jgi:predicted small lipoprotein YifL